MKKRNILLSLMIMLSAFWTGCTHEDYRNCPAGLYIAFEPINPKQDYPAAVQNVSLYFYDPATGLLAEEFHYVKEELRESDRAAFVPQIPTGTYRVVAVVNCGIYTQTTDVENYSTLRTRLNEPVMDFEPGADFFTAEKEIAVTVNTSEVIPVETMAIVKHNKNIYLNIVYDGYEIDPEVTFTSWLEGSNCCYEYATDSNMTSATYLPWDMQAGDNGLPSRFNMSTMRISTDSDLTLHLNEVAATRAASRNYSFVLADELAKLIDEDNGGYLYDTDDELAFEDEFEITIKIGKDNVQIAVGVDQWASIGGGIEL